MSANILAETIESFTLHGVVIIRKISTSYRVRDRCFCTFFGTTPAACVDTWKCVQFTESSDPLHLLFGLLFKCMEKSIKMLQYLMWNRTISVNERGTTLFR